jgi:tRNA nucleotidyltransferase (CCA-adding enzyme)
VAHHLKPLSFYKADPRAGDGAFRRLAEKVDLELLARLALSDCLGRAGAFDCSGIEWFLHRARELGVEHAPPEPIVKGRHLLALGLQPGPRVGEILRHVYERQLDGAVTSLEAGIALAKQLLDR